ncbi:MAG: hypothetical protein M3Y69_05515 [Verrucomicrobiota bacterium]|nr:hypothetical protein [Verrucomicrobiota bacterium]
MKINSLFNIIAAGVIALGSTALASPVKTYQVTGPIMEMNDSMIVVQKEKGKDERWEIARDSSTKASGEMKVGDRVTITYTMMATNVEVKAAKGAKADTKASAAPASSPAKK